MLILTRKKNESIAIGDGITITVVEIRGDGRVARLGICAPKEFPVHRQEVFDTLHGWDFVPHQFSPDEAALLQAVLEAPEDDGIRLIYADWLEERGDPRAEFIRIQCRLAQLPARAKGRKALVCREESLLLDNEFVWRQTLPPILRNQQFVRGFIETVSTTILEFVEHADLLFSLTPIRHLHVKYSWYDRDFAKFVGLPHLARLRTIDLSYNQITEDGALALAASPYLANLARLDLSGNQIGAKGIQALRERFAERVVFG